MRKKIIFIVLCVCLLLVGCGKQNQEKCFLKVVSELDKESVISQPMIEGDKIYSVLADEKQRTIRCYDIETTDYRDIYLKDSKLKKINAFTVNAEGNIFIYGINTAGKAIIEKYTDENKIEEIYIPELSEDIQKIDVDKDGNIAVWQENKILVFDSQGKKKFQITSLSIVTGMALDDRNSLIVSGYLDKKRIIQKYDIESGEVKESNTDTPEISMDCGFCIAGDRVYINNGVELFEFQDGDVSVCVNLISYGINGDNIQAFSVFEDKIVIIEKNNIEKSFQKIILSQSNQVVSVERKQLTLAGYNINNNIKEQVTKYNNENGEYYINIIDYSQYDYEDAYKRMQIELTTGNVPDILVLNNYNDVEKYADNGIIEDLTDRYCKEGRIDKEDILNNIIDANKINEKLYCLVSDFSLSMLVGNSQNFTENMDLNTFLEYQKNQDNPLLATSYGREAVLLYLTVYNIENYVEENKCDFRQEQFEEILALSKKYSQQFSDNEILELIKNNEKVLLPIEICDIYDCQKYYELFEGNAEFMGFPSNDKSKVIQKSSAYFTIPVNADEKEEAWNFIAGFLTTEFQHNQKSMYIPISMSVVQEKIQASKEVEYYQDELGQQYEKVQKVFQFSEYENHIVKTNDEVCYIFEKMITGEVEAAGYDMDIWEIISEEVQNYYNDIKSEEQIVEGITTRVNICLQERE